MGIEQLFADPNFQQMLGRAGQTIGDGGSVGAALNPSETIRNVQTQNATAQLLAQLLGGGQPQGQAPQQQNIQQQLNPPSSNGTPFKMPPMNNAQGMQNILDVFKGVTPVGQDGIDGITHNLTPTGSTTTIKNSPNVQNFSGNTPAEAQPQGGGTPFLQAFKG